MGLFAVLRGEEPNILKKIDFMITNRFDKGAYGEYLTEYMFGNNNLEGYSKSLHNVYVPYKDKTSEIDVILVHEKGIFVIESKNYSGWIFGSENQYQWTQCLQNGQKNKFYNPIKQNATHINAISQYLNIEKSKMKSFIVFSERCELKKVPDDTTEYTILRRHHLLRTLRKEIENRDNILTVQEVDRFIEKLLPITNVSEEIKQEHIKRIKNSKDTAPETQMNKNRFANTWKY